MRVRAVGKLDLLPDSLLSAIRVAEEATAAHRGMLLTIAVAYGGRQEIIDAVQALLRDKSTQGEDLDTRPVPLRARPARPRPHHPHQRRGPALGLPATSTGRPSAGSTIGNGLTAWPRTFRSSRLP